MLRRSLRAPAEAELLRRNPFRNYQEAVELSEIPDVSKIPASALDDRAPRAVSSNHTHASSSARPADSSSSQRKSQTATAPTGQKKEKVASPLHQIYPDGFPGAEFSIEEIRAMRLGMRDLRAGSLTLPGEEKWQHEARENGIAYRFDAQGSIILRDPASGRALFAYLAKQDAAEQEAKLAQCRREKGEATERDRQAAEAAVARQQAEDMAARAAEEQRQLRLQAEARRKRAAEAEEAAAAARRAKQKHRQEEEARKQAEEEAERLRRLRMAQEAEHQRQQEAAEQERRRNQTERERQDRLVADAADEAKVQEHLLQRHEEQRRRHQPQAEAEDAACEAAYRPPSPTINTKAALAEVNAMFARTMHFDGEVEDDAQDDSDTASSSDEADDFEQEPDTPLVPSQAETEDTFWSHSQPSQSVPIAPQSQVSTFYQSQTQSQADSASFAPSEGSTTEESETEQDYQSAKLVTGQGLSTSSSTSSVTSSNNGFGESHAQGETSLSPEQHLRQTFKSSRQPFIPEQKAGAERVSTVGDENENPTSMTSKAVASTARPAFRPTRIPLGAKPLSGSITAPAPAPAFKVFSESEEEPYKPASNLNGQIGVHEAPHSVEEDAAQSGYEMGRRPAGTNRFAFMMDVMTPITERTCEFGTTTGTRDLAEMTAWAVRTDAEASAADLEGAEDLVSSRGSSWEMGRMQLEAILEGAEASGCDAPRIGSEGKSVEAGALCLLG